MTQEETTAVADKEITEIFVPELVEVKEEGAQEAPSVSNILSDIHETFSVEKDSLDSILNIGFTPENIQIISNMFDEKMSPQFMAIDTSEFYSVYTDRIRFLSLMMSLERPLMVHYNPGDTPNIVNCRKINFLGIPNNKYTVGSEFLYSIKSDLELTTNNILRTNYSPVYYVLNPMGLCKAKEYILTKMSERINRASYLDEDLIETISNSNLKDESKKELLLRFIYINQLSLKSSAISSKQIITSVSTDKYSPENYYAGINRFWDVHYRNAIIRKLHDDNIMSINVESLIMELAATNNHTFEEQIVRWSDSSRLWYYKGDLQRIIDSSVIDTLCELGIIRIMRHNSSYRICLTDTGMALATKLSSKITNITLRQQTTDDPGF